MLPRRGTWWGGGCVDAMEHVIVQRSSGGCCSHHPTIAIIQSIIHHPSIIYPSIIHQLVDLSIVRQSSVNDPSAINRISTNQSWIIQQSALLLHARRERRRSPSTRVTWDIDPSPLETITPLPFDAPVPCPRPCLYALCTRDTAPAIWRRHLLSLTSSKHTT